MQKPNETYEKVYALVRKIPQGKVTTYGTIAKKLSMSPRTIGQVLHANPYEGDVPCHRVVNRDGRIAPNFAFGGLDIQRKLLESEGVKFKDEKHVDLSKQLFTF
ncbi:MAG: MGMT family protein [Candidatus Levybacteria bacterium]|nr:MGMT family protein [Candidatus Levybacteria bacterium]